MELSVGKLILKYQLLLSQFSLYTEFVPYFSSPLVSIQVEAIAMVTNQKRACTQTTVREL